MKKPTDALLAVTALYSGLRAASELFGVMRQEPYFSTVELDEYVKLAARAHADMGCCARCLVPIKDFRPPTDGGMTAGYYVASAWEKYARPGEIYICDNCMFADPKYIADYGDHR